jgi:hypothetical protein
MTSRSRRRAIGVLAISATTALGSVGFGPAAISPTAGAQTFSGFQTPTGNIQCSYYSDDGGALRCAVLEYEGPVPPVPNDCDLDWQPGAAMSDRSRAQIFVCAGDTIVDNYPIVGYGSTWKKGGVTCSIAKTGVTCRNRTKKGFFLSRAVIKRV